MACVSPGMADATPEILYAAMDKNVAAIDAATGAEIWRRKLPKGGGLVNMLIKGDFLYVSSDGYVYCLERFMGEILWRNDMKKLGFGAVMLAMPGASPTSAPAAAALMAQQAAAAVAAAG